MDEIQTSLSTTLEDSPVVKKREKYHFLSNSTQFPDIAEQLSTPTNTFSLNDCQSCPVSPKTEQNDADASERYLNLENFDPTACLSPQNNGTAEIPYLGVRLPQTSDAISLDPEASPSHILRCTPFASNNSYGTAFKAENSLATNQEYICGENITVIHLAGKSTDEVRALFQATDETIISAILSFWEVHQRNCVVIDDVEELLDDKGIKLKRRKRMGPEIPASEKKAIRAERNRERSQVLRKHHKTRMQSMEQSIQHLTTENSAMRSLINCLLEESGALPLLHTYFEENGCSETLVSFLRYIT